MIVMEATPRAAVLDKIAEMAAGLKKLAHLMDYDSPLMTYHRWTTPAERATTLETNW